MPTPLGWFDTWVIVFLCLLLALLIYDMGAALIRVVSGWLVRWDRRAFERHQRAELFTADRFTTEERVWTEPPYDPLQNVPRDYGDRLAQISPEALKEHDAKMHAGMGQAAGMRHQGSRSVWTEEAIDGTDCCDE